MSAPADVSSRVGPPATARRTLVSDVRVALFAAADDVLEAPFVVAAGPPRAGLPGVDAGAEEGFAAGLIGAGAGAGAGSLGADVTGCADAGGGDGGGDAELGGAA